MNYFSEVIYVDSNPAILKTERKFKENGKLKIEKNRNEIRLKTLLLFEDSKNLMAPECGCSGIIQDIKNLKPVIFNYNYSFIKSIFVNKNRILSFFLQESINEDNYLMTSSTISKKIKKYLPNNTIHQIDSIDEYFRGRLENKIIIGKKVPIFLHKNYDKVKDFESIEVFYYTDLSEFSVINLV